MNFFEFSEQIEADGASGEEHLFFEDLTGEAVGDGQPAGPGGYDWARRVFDEVSRIGSPPGSLVSGAADGSPWIVVAPPGSNTPDDIRSGDLVVKRGRRVSLLVVDATVTRPELFRPDGRVLPDTLVLRA